jgi:hypothetical protein
MYKYVVHTNVITHRSDGNSVCVTVISNETSTSVLQVLCKGTNAPMSHFFCAVKLKAVDLHVPYVVFVV